MKSIAVIFGGISVEKEVSVLTGVLTLNSIKDKYDVIPVFMDKTGVTYSGKELLDIESYKNLPYKKLDRITFLSGDNAVYKIKKNGKVVLFKKVSCVINCLHGRGGEDGQIVGLMNLCKIPVASPDTLPSALFMDKHLTKIALKGIGVKTLPDILLESIGDIEKIKDQDFPVIIKPVDLGSSIGISTAKNKDELIDGVSNAFRYSDRVLVEPQLLDFTEINCAVYSTENKVVVSECEKPLRGKDILSFDDKYSFGDREFPADIEEQLKKKIQGITEKIYKTFIRSGIIRIDFLIKDKKVFVNEINTVPGSLSYYLFCDTFKDFSEILDGIIEKAIKIQNVKNSLIYDFSSSVLKVKSGKGQKRL